MASKLHQNAILTGCVDSFCLVCEGHLRSERDATTHIQKPIHSKNLILAPYLTKFADDHIRKVKKGYFCEFCNVLLPTAAKVGLHVTEQTHNNNKGLQLITRSGNYVVVFDSIVITELAWNGLIMDTCAVCNVEFHNLNLHVADHKHILNLIQKKVEFDGSTVFRKVDDTSFHCLICNAIFASNTVTAHYKHKNHITSYDSCKEKYQSSSANNTSQYVNRTNDVKNYQGDAQQSQSQAGNNLNKNAIDIKVKPVHANNVNEGPKLKQSDEKIENIDNTRNDSLNGNCNNQTHSTHINTRDDPCVDKSKSTKKENTQEKTKAQKENTTKNSQNDKQKVKFVSNDKQQTKTQVNNMKQTNGVGKENLFEHVSEFQKNGVNITFETEMAFCKKCFKDVDFNIDTIQQHIDEHKINPKKEVTANNAHTNQGRIRTILNSKDKDDEVINKPIVNFDLNHNVTKSKTKNESTEEKEEEIIKIDLTKKSNEDFTTEENDNAVARYVPGKSAPEPAKQKETAQKPATKQTQDTNDAETFAKQNSLTYNKGNGNAFCRICNTRVPSTIKNMKEHVGGLPHKTKAARIAQAEKAPKVMSRPMGKFIYVTSTVMNYIGEDVDDVILNDKYCLTRMSYYMITTLNRLLRCQACEVTLSREGISNHVDSHFHERAMGKTPVVTCLSSTEFIREVRPGVFHCGYCNQVIGVWQIVSSHLQCCEHVNNMREANRRLQRHLPGILQHRAIRDQVCIRHILQQLLPTWD